MRSGTQGTISLGFQCGDFFIAVEDCESSTYDEQLILHRWPEIEIGRIAFRTRLAPRTPQRVQSRDFSSQCFNQARELRIG